mgnify:CR=1 FL=1
MSATVDSFLMSCALTLLAYFSLMLSSIATALSLEKSSGEICTRSDIVVWPSQWTSLIDTVMLGN